jgi:hypothetical protein
MNLGTLYNTLALPEYNFAMDAYLSVVYLHNSLFMHSVCLPYVFYTYWSMYTPMRAFTEPSDGGSRPSSACFDSWVSQDRSLAFSAKGMRNTSPGHLFRSVTFLPATYSIGNLLETRRKSRNAWVWLGPLWSSQIGVKIFQSVRDGLGPLYWLTFMVLWPFLTLRKAPK